MTPKWDEWVRQGLVGLVMAAGLYAGVRADLATLHERTAQALKQAEKAHDRIDALSNRKEN